MAEIAITAEHITKVFCTYSRTRDRYLDFFLPGEFGNRFYALRDVSFTLEKGHSLGLVGLNGSGKSTLANIIAGASAPTTGNLTINGTVSMTSVSSGVLPALTGRENIMQKCLLLGLNKKDILRLMPEIIEFSELGDVIDQQVKTYSSGMRSKLGFAISINIDPDILIIDEALSVGDQTFTQKCLNRMRAFRQQGKTIVFVSHSISQMRRFCDQALWLEGGQVVQIGSSQEITAAYAKFIEHFNSLPEEEQKAYKQNIRKRQAGGTYGQGKEHA
ncbi:ABC transporter ATP-binding protein [Flavonifractor plautii]|uniref:ABC transporter ATP-binding protein n=1 Tax=Flavonifractor plautii TaxID=292800 RepID=UPI0019560845|nr:ABC transporter ATP-binding protein [Flavonifractor plautii]MBM6665309.1 ABC transporter ATP-binding protein [Flavonifractor plautii]